MCFNKQHIYFFNIYWKEANTNNSYIINKNTLLIKSTIDKKGVVIFDDKKTINLDIILHKFINDCSNIMVIHNKGKFESSKYI